MNEGFRHETFWSQDEYSNRIFTTILKSDFYDWKNKKTINVIIIIHLSE
jgi:hypothetical protein